MNFNRRTSLALAGAVSAACALASLPAGAATLTITDNACSSFTSTSDGQGNLTISCGGAQSATCTLSASSTTIPATGGSVTLTSNCGTVSSWTKNGAAGGNGQTSWTDTFGAATSASDVSYTYTVTGANGKASASVMQKGTGSTSGGGAPGAIACNGFTNTRVIPINWGPLKSGSVSVYSKNFGGFINNDIVVASFTTPSVTSPGALGAIQAAEYQSTAISRTASLSTSPCSFDNGLGATGSIFSSISGAALVSGNTVTVSYMVGGSSVYYPVLQPNTTYYYNIRNTNGVGGDIKIELIKPTGL